MSTIQIRILIYFFIPLSIIGWWALAFKSNQSNRKFESNPKVISSDRLAYSELSIPVTPISRDKLQQALQGDFRLMSRLIADWDLEAQLLQSQGFEGIARLPYHDFIRSQLLIRQKKCAPSSPVYLSDDAGKVFDLTQNYQRFLPQTHAAASVLLTLAPEQIVAIPNGMREQTHLYPASLMDKIPLDIHRYYAEKLFLEKPDIAFVAHYSHPSTLAAMEQQGIRLFTMKNAESIKDVQNAIGVLGALSQKESEADLLQLFMEAAFIAIDNHLAAIKKIAQKDPSRFLYLNYYCQFSVPTDRPIAGQLLKRLGLSETPLTKDVGSQNLWRVNISAEQIMHWDPEAIIISTTQPKEIWHSVFSNSSLRMLPAIQQGHCFFVDESVQDSPTQYVVLAYYDLFHAIASLIIWSPEQVTI